MGAPCLDPETWESTKPPRPIYCALCPIHFVFSAKWVGKYETQSTIVILSESAVRRTSRRICGCSFEPQARKWVPHPKRVLCVWVGKHGLQPGTKMGAPGLDPETWESTKSSVPHPLRVLREMGGKARTRRVYADRCGQLFVFRHPSARRSRSTGRPAIRCSATISSASSGRTPPYHTASG
jgi:hypothetical protein